MTVNRRIAPAFFTAFLVIIIDRATKLAACKALSAGQSAVAIPDIFHFTLVLNKGAAFGILKGMTSFFIFLSVAVAVFIILYIWKGGCAGAASAVASGLILGGAFGNLFDRIRFGYVIDFLDFRVWPVFNVADSCITIGAVLLGWSIIKSKR